MLKIHTSSYTKVIMSVPKGQQQTPYSSHMQNAILLAKRNMTWQTCMTYTMPCLLVYLKMTQEQRTLIHNKGLGAIMENMPTLLGQWLLEVRGKFVQCINTALNVDQHFTSALDKASESFVNFWGLKSVCKVHEALATSWDNWLKKSTRIEKAEEDRLNSFVTD